MINRLVHHYLEVKIGHFTISTLNWLVHAVFYIRDVQKFQLVESLKLSFFSTSCIPCLIPYLFGFFHSPSLNLERTILKKLGTVPRQEAKASLTDQIECTKSTQ